MLADFDADLQMDVLVVLNISAEPGVVSVEIYWGNNTDISVGRQPCF
jgi:hypothetical protein